MSNIYKDEPVEDEYVDDLTILPVRVPPVEKKIKHHPTLPDVNKGACIVDIAKPRSGKTLRLVNYLQNPNFYADKFDAVYIYSSTMSNGDDTARFLYDQYADTIYSEYSDAHLQSIIDYQDSIPKAQRPKISVIFDDFIAFPNVHKNSLMFKIATSYRHHNIGLLLYNTQMLKYLPPVVRASANYVILSQNSNMKQIEALSEEYGGTYGVEKWKQIYSIATNEPYGFLYMDLYGFTGSNNNPKAYSNFNKLLYEAPISYSKKNQKMLNRRNNVVVDVVGDDEEAAAVV
ncbi:MAG: hypothetical protein H8E16_17305 [Flavobacteriales bacterium]|nr:hypothetical protein [Flavobacteriales bacterium]